MIDCCLVRIEPADILSQLLKLNRQIGFLRNTSSNWLKDNSLKVWLRLETVGFCVVLTEYLYQPLANAQKMTVEQLCQLSCEKNVSNQNSERFTL